MRREISAALVTLAACTAGAFLCQWLHTPLPWMIGPLFVMAILSVTGVQAVAPPGSRQIGQVIIATALGLYFTPTVASEVIGYDHVLIAAAVLAIGLAYGGAFFVARYANIDRSTAFFASVPGGAAENAVTLQPAVERERRADTAWHHGPQFHNPGGCAAAFSEEWIMVKFAPPISTARPTRELCSSGPPDRHHIASHQE